MEWAMRLCSLVWSTQPAKHWRSSSRSRRSMRLDSFVRTSSAEGHNGAVDEPPGLVDGAEPRDRANHRTHQGVASCLTLAGHRTSQGLNSGRIPQSFDPSSRDRGWYVSRAFDTGSTLDGSERVRWRLLDLLVLWCHGQWRVRAVE